MRPIWRFGWRVGCKRVRWRSAPQVKAGQLIATLDPDDYALAATAAQAQRVAAEAEARLAQQDLQRYIELRAQNFISQAELDRRQTAADAAQARLRQLRAEAARQGNQQAYTRLTAPYAGVVTAIFVEAGQVVAAGQPVAQLAKHGEREVRIDVPENALEALRAARTLDDHAVVGARRDLCRPSARTVADGRCGQPHLPCARQHSAPRCGGEAGHDRHGRASTAQAAPRLSVAQSALFKINGQPQVWVVDRKTGKVAARSVQLGELTGDRAAIVSGLAAGEWVVTAGVHKLAPGQQVRLVPPAQS